MASRAGAYEVSEEYKLHLRRVKEHQVTFNNAELIRSFTQTFQLQAQAVRRGRAAGGVPSPEVQRLAASLLLLLHSPLKLLWEARMFIWTVLIKCSLIQIVIEEINRETSLENCVFIKMSFNLEISSLLILD